MRGFRSIRWRLQVWYGLLLLAVLAGFGITAYRLESSRLARLVDEELRRRIPLLVASQHPVPGTNPQLRELTVRRETAALFDTGGSGSAYYVVWLRHGTTRVTRSPSAPAEVPMPRAGDPPTRRRGVLQESFVFPGPGDCILVGRSVADDLDWLRRLRWYLALAGAGVLALGVAVGSWLVNRALRPVGQIGATAREIARGDLTRRIGTADTDSELGELAAVLDSTFARLDAAFAQQARFTADAAHELRTPLSVILTHADNGLAATCGNPEHREAFEAIRRAAQRMRRLVGSLLHLARLEAGGVAPPRGRVELGPVVRDAVELVRPLAAERGITVDTDVDEVACLGVAEHLPLVASNLIANAVVHNRPGGRVRVRLRGDAREAVLVVEDDGPGIAPADLPLVFDRFFRADRSRSAASGGTGLGLAIAKAVVETHGGSIVAESEPGVVTRFTVRLPAAAEPTEAQG